jgi:hypothetical protein
LHLDPRRRGQPNGFPSSRARSIPARVRSDGPAAAARVADHREQARVAGRGSATGSIAGCARPPHSTIGPTVGRRAPPVMGGPPPAATARLTRDARWCRRDRLGRAQMPAPHRRGSPSSSAVQRHRACRSCSRRSSARTASACAHRPGSVTDPTWRTAGGGSATARGCRGGSRTRCTSHSPGGRRTRRRSKGPSRRSGRTIPRSPARRGPGAPPRGAAYRRSGELSGGRATTDALAPSGRDSVSQ